MDESNLVFWREKEREKRERRRGGLLDKRETDREDGQKKGAVGGSD